MLDEDCEFVGDRFVPCKAMKAMIESRTVAGIGAGIVTLFKNGMSWEIGVEFNFTKESASAIEEMEGKTRLMMTVCPFCKQKSFEPERRLPSSEVSKP
jgi:hypothetical protein